MIDSYESSFRDGVIGNTGGSGPSVQGSNPCLGAMALLPQPLPSISEVVGAGGNTVIATGSTHWHYQVLIANKFGKFYLNGFYHGHSCVCGSPAVVLIGQEYMCDTQLKIIEEGVKIRLPRVGAIADVA